MRRSPLARSIAGSIAAAALALAAGSVPAPGVAAQEPPNGAALEVRIAPGPHTVGDRVEVGLTLRLPAADPEPAPAAGAADLPRFPDWGPTWGEAEVMAVGEVERLAAGDEGADPGLEPGLALFRQRLELAAFRPGELELPPVTVAVPAGAGVGEADDEVELSTPEGLTLTVDSVLPAQGESAEEPTLEPPAPPRELPLGTRFWVTLIAMTAALVLALAWAIFRRRPAARAAAAPPPPFEELRAALAAARGEGSPAAGHTRLSLALRRYLGRALDFSGLERSTAEIRRELTGRRLPDGVARRAVALLAGCDLVKFARRPATAAELERRAGAALDLAGEIEAHLHPPTAPIVEPGAVDSGREAA